MSATAYKTDPRTAFGGKATAKLRAAGKVPLTIARKGKDSVHLAIDEISANHLAKHVANLCTIEVDGKPVSTLRSQVDRDCVTDRIRHIDLIEVDAKGKITVEVALHADAATCPGVKAGGICERRLRKIKVTCAADSIPARLEVDLTNVQIMQTVTADMVTLPKGVTLATPAKAQILSIVVPRAMKTEEPTAAAAAATAEGAAAAPAAAAADGKAPAAAAADPKAAAKAPAADPKKK